jgi:hypothetical protein
MMYMAGSRSRDGGSRYYDEYSEYAKNLRTWFVAYGIGGPVVIMTQGDLYSRILGSGEAAEIAVVFLIGVAIQMCVALLYKAAAWRLHYNEDIKGESLTNKDWAKRVEKSYAIDVICDLVTLLLLAYSTYRVAAILTADSSRLTSACSWRALQF